MRKLDQMLIVADENIPYVQEAFGALGEVRTASGRALSRRMLEDAQVLLVRSVTTVGSELLDGTPVRFVATATIGTEHVDAAYLATRGIGFASAPGSNANSVAEYVVAALLVAAGRLGWRLEGRSIGVIGVGNVGSLVVKNSQALGMTVLQNDPPLSEQTGDPAYRPLEELFDCDILTLHVPLTTSGPYPTRHMADENFFRRMRPGSMFLNTSRGSVHDTAALQRSIEEGRLSATVLDVWEDEPDISCPLLEQVALGTPHIAGYSFDGKVRGVEMIHAAACGFLGVEPAWQADLPPPPCPRLTVDAGGRDDEDVLRQVVSRVYDIEADDRGLREMLCLPTQACSAHFDALRRNYPVRREFPNTTVEVAGGPDSVRAKLTGLGLNVTR